MKSLLLLFLSVVLVSLTACGSSASTGVDGEGQTTAKDKLSLDAAPDILDLSALLPDNFENLDAASEGLSHDDLELTSEYSEVYVYFSEDEPFQLMYHFLAITDSRIEAASFDSMLDDEEGLKQLLIESIVAGAAEEGVDIDFPSISISHPQIGDKSILGTGIIDWYGYLSGMDMLFFRLDNVYYYGYSIYWSDDQADLVPIGEEVAKRITAYEQ